MCFVGPDKSLRSIVTDALCVCVCQSCYNITTMLMVHGILMLYITELIRDGYMYLYHDDRDNMYDQASGKCQAWGGHLVSITSREESLFVSSKRAKYRVANGEEMIEPCFIGLVSNYTAGNCPVCDPGTFVVIVEL